MSLDRGRVWKQLGAPTDQEGSVNDPRTREEHGVTWNEKWIYRGEDGQVGRARGALEPLRPRRRLPREARRHRRGRDASRELACSSPAFDRGRLSWNTRGRTRPVPASALRPRPASRRSWTHEGQPLLNRKMREVFDRSVRYLPARGTRASTSCRSAATAARSTSRRRASSCATSTRRRAACASRTARGAARRPPPAPLAPRRGAAVPVKRDLVPEGLLARFDHAAQAELLLAIDETPDGMVLRMAGRSCPLPVL